MSQLLDVHPDRYKWIALTNTTLGVFMAVINGSIILISLPAIFRGIGINPLLPGNVGYLLWLLMGYLLVTAVLVISLGPVSYTHLDVYKRQVNGRPHRLRPSSIPRKGRSLT